MQRAPNDPLLHLSNRLQAAFVRLAKDDSLWHAELDAALRHITTSLAGALDVARVSVWFLEADGALSCACLFRADQGNFDQGQRLVAHELPAYFRALELNRVIDAADAVNDQRTAEFAEAYLRPLGIGAMLDATIHRAGKVGGVLCIEHIGSPRLWSRDEQNFAVSVADLLSQLLVVYALRNSERRYRGLFDQAGDAIMVWSNRRFIDCNNAATSLFRCSREQLLSMSVLQLSPPAQADGRASEEAAAAYLTAALAGDPQHFSWRHRRPDGSDVDCEVSLAAYRQGREVSITAIARDVSARRAAEHERALAAAELERSNNALLLVNALANRLLALNAVEAVARETVRMLNDYQPEALVSFYVVDDDPAWLRRVAWQGTAAQGERQDDRLARSDSLCGRALREGVLVLCPDILADREFALWRKEQLTQRGFRALVALPLIYNEQALGAVAMLFPEPLDMHGNERFIFQAVLQTVALAMANARHTVALEHQTQHDTLTGLPNRTRLHQIVGPALEGPPSKESGASLMLLDLDRFKEVNDTLGHQAGDQLLKLVAQRLRELGMRAGVEVFRLGGDEFSLFKAGLGDAKQATALAQDVVRTLSRPFEVMGISIELGASVGISLFPQHGDSSNALLRCADVAMYGAKSGGAGVAVYDPAQDVHSPRRLTLITELGAAIRGNQLNLHFQPKLDLQRGTWSGCEALVRWRHPMLGQIPPGDFIQFAEMSDQMRPLSLWVARAALGQMQAWQQHGLPLKVAVNLSARNLLDVTFPDALAELLNEFALPAHLLELEITETALIGDPDRARQVVERLAALGAHLSIDDFGTGYSSLAYLKRLPLSALKIDRSFVRDMLRDEQDAIIVRSTIGLAHSLGLRVVAEGVEDGETLARLREFGCDEAQGYFLSKPQPAGDLQGLLSGPPPA